MHVSGSAGIHHPGVTLQRHLLHSSHETRCVPLRLAAGLLRSDRRVGLGSRPEESRAAALLSATRALAAAVGAARLTLLAPWIDADPWAIRVWRAWLLVPAAAAAAALAVVLPPPPWYCGCCCCTRNSLRQRLKARGRSSMTRCPASLTLRSAAFSPRCLRVPFAFMHRRLTGECV